MARFLDVPKTIHSAFYDKKIALSSETPPLLSTSIISPKNTKYFMEDFNNRIMKDSFIYHKEVCDINIHNSVHPCEYGKIKDNGSYICKMKWKDMIQYRLNTKEIEEICDIYVFMDRLSSIGEYDTLDKCLNAKYDHFGIAMIKEQIVLSENESWFDSLEY
jgi:hypothetical protein